ncbi:hypothetical protein [Halocola ammonii]
MKNFILSFILITFFCGALTSCGSQGDDHNHDSTSHKVELNNGEKWKANPATTTGIEKMKKLVDEFEKGQNSDFGQLQSKLQKEFSLIFEKCTMTGEAHNQLHNYLAPLSKQLKKLEKGTLEEKEIALKKIENHLNSFDQFFK